MDALLGLIEDPLADFGKLMAEYSVPLGTVALVVVGLMIARRLLLNGPKAKGAEARLPRQLLMFGLTVAGLLAVFLSTPLDSATRGQLLQLVGVLFTAVLALSSATFFSNAMAGMMVRMIKCFRPGDFVRVKNEFGRVTERGLFHVELQTEDGDLTTLPNLYLITNPVSVVRSKGTVISATVSLGYDEPRERVEILLKLAAEKAELTDAFVHVVDLGDFSIIYKVAGFSTDVGEMLTTRSNLRKEILDALHGGNIEIMSPAFMTQRQINQDDAMIPTRTHRPVKKGKKKRKEPAAEAVIFDKGNRAANLENLKDQHASVVGEIVELAGTKETGEEKKAQAAQLEQLEDHAAKLLGDIDESVRGLSEDDRPKGS